MGNLLIIAGGSCLLITEANAMDNDVKEDNKCQWHVTHGKEGAKKCEEDTVDCPDPNSEHINSQHCEVHDQAAWNFDNAAAAFPNFCDEFPERKNSLAKPFTLEEAERLAKLQVNRSKQREEQELLKLWWDYFLNQTSFFWWDYFHSKIQCA